MHESPGPGSARPLLAQLRGWGRELGFSQIGIAGIDLATAEPGLARLAGQRFSRRDGLHGRARPEARPAGRAGAGHGQRDHRALDYLPRDTPDGLAGDRVAAPRRARRRRRSRSTPAAATITRCCARGCSSWPTGWPTRSGRSAIASSPIRRRCSRSSWPRAAASAGAASTRWRSTARPARCSSSARSTSTWRCRRRAPVERALRQLQRLHRRLPDAAPSSRRTGSMRGAASPT